MSFSESLTKNLEFTKKLYKKCEIEPWKIIGVCIGLLIMYREIGYLIRMHLVPVLIGVLICFITSVKLRGTFLILITYLWIIIKIIVYSLYKLFYLPFKVGEKYNNLDEREKSVVKTATVFLVGLAARHFIKAGLSQDNSTFVDPHEVSGYTRADGTKVDGYWRDGDGNPFTNRTKEQGGGYFRNK